MAPQRSAAATVRGHGTRLRRLRTPRAARCGKLPEELDAGKPPARICEGGPERTSYSTIAPGDRDLISHFVRVSSRGMKIARTSVWIRVGRVDCIRPDRLQSELFSDLTLVSVGLDLGLAAPPRRLPPRAGLSPDIVLKINGFPLCPADPDCRGGVMAPRTGVGRLGDRLPTN